MRFPFDYKKHFVPEQNSEDCVPACIAMAAMYWKSRMPKLALPTKIDEWKSYFDELRVHSHRGTNLVMLKSALKRLKKDGIGLSLRLIQPKHIADLTKLFELKDPIPVILCYDRSMVINNFQGPNHASLFITLDTWKEDVEVVDPSQVRRESPMTYKIADFLKGWNQVQNLAILAFPSSVSVPLNMRDRNTLLPLESYRK